MWRRGQSTCTLHPRVSGVWQIKTTMELPQQHSYSYRLPCTNDTFRTVRLALCEGRTGDLLEGGPSLPKFFFYSFWLAMVRLIIINKLVQCAPNHLTRWFNFKSISIHIWHTSLGVDTMNPVSHLVYTVECASIPLAFASLDRPLVYGKWFMCTSFKKEGEWKQLICYECYEQTNVVGWVMMNFSPCFYIWWTYASLQNPYMYIEVNSLKAGNPVMQVTAVWFA